MDIVNELENRFPSSANIESEKEKKAFVKLFGKYLRAESILQNYDEFTSLKALQTINFDNPDAVETFKTEYYLDDEKFAELQIIRLPAVRKIQDYRSSYNDNLFSSITTSMIKNRELPENLKHTTGVMSLSLLCARYWVSKNEIKKAKEMAIYGLSKVRLGGQIKNHSKKY